MTDREKLVELLEYGMGKYFLLHFESEIIADVLVANGVRIPVKCEECAHRIEDKDFARGHYCKKRPSNGGYFCEDNDFCSYGERRSE